MISLPNNIRIRSSRDTVGPDSRLEMFIWAASGNGKTRLAGSLHRLTTKYLGKPTLYIAVESGEGGGAVTIRDMDVPLYQPKDLTELKATLSALKNDKQFGGVVIDSATEMVKQYIKPVALKFPPRERSVTILAPREAGVPSMSDYGSMGELTRQVFQDLLNISSNPNPELKKHVIVTALDKQKNDEEGRVSFWGPSLPGAMAGEAAGMFQIVGTIELKTQVVNGRRIVGRYLNTKPDGAKLLKDRFGIFPAEVLLKDPITNEGLDLCDIWEQFWLPEIAKNTNSIQSKEVIKG